MNDIGGGEGTLRKAVSHEKGQKKQREVAGFCPEKGMEMKTTTTEKKMVCIKN